MLLQCGRQKFPPVFALSLLQQGLHRLAKSNSPLAHRSAAGTEDQPGRTLKSALGNGRALVGGMLTEYARPGLVKLYVHAGFDFLYIEYEHGFFDLPTLVDTVLCARDNGLPAIA